MAWQHFAETVRFRGIIKQLGWIVGRNTRLHRVVFLNLWILGHSTGCDVECSLFHSFVLLSLMGGSWFLKGCNHYLFFREKDQLVQSLMILKLGRSLLLWQIEQHMEGSKTFPRDRLSFCQAIWLKFWKINRSLIGSRFSYCKLCKDVADQMLSPICFYNPFYLWTLLFNDLFL